MEEQHALVAIPLKKFDSSRLVAILRHDRKLFDYIHFPDTVFLLEDSQSYEEDDFPEELSLSELGLAFFLTLGDSTWFLRRSRNIATDGRDVDAEDQADGAQLIYFSKTDDTSSWLLGVSWSGGMDVDTWIPLVGYNHKGKTLAFRSVLPSFAILKYMPTDSWYFLWDTSAESSAFRLTEASPWESSVMSFVQVTSRLEFGYHTSPGLEVGLSYGWTVYRRMKLKNSGLDPIGNLDLEPQPLWGLYLQWVL